VSVWSGLWIRQNLSLTSLVPEFYYIFKCTIIVLFCLGAEGKKSGNCRRVVAHFLGDLFRTLGERMIVGFWPPKIIDGRDD